MFQNREAAAKLLLKKLKKYKGKNPLVLGIPRGAMPMAKIIAEGLAGELSAVLVHKIPAPDNEELAIGSIGLSGHVHRLPEPYFFEVPETYVQAAAQSQLERLRKRNQRFGLKRPNYKGRIVIVVDDGIATGATTIGALYEVRLENPQKLILAAAVSSPQSASQIRPLVDEFVVLAEPEGFYAVSQFFEEFPEVTDDQAAEILNAARGKPEKSAAESTL